MYRFRMKGKFKSGEHNLHTEKSRSERYCLMCRQTVAVFEADLRMADLVVRIQTRDHAKIEMNISVRLRKSRPRAFY